MSPKRPQDALDARSKMQLHQVFMCVDQLLSTDKDALDLGDLYGSFNRVLTHLSSSIPPMPSPQCRVEPTPHFGA